MEVKQKIDISVIIPTYKRPEKLNRLLKSLKQQTYKNFEALVIDNDCDKKIEGLVLSFKNQCPFPLRYFKERKLGLHEVRHTGLREARGKILILTEDEVTFDHGWINAYANAFLKHPDMRVAGGPLKPVWEEKPPQWLLELIGNSKTFPPLSLINLSNKFFISSHGSFFGGNMAIYKDLLIELGGFNPEYFGAILLGDGETGLNYKIWKKKISIGYVPGALIYHHIDKNRMTVEAINYWMDNEGRCDVYSLFSQKKKPFYRLSVVMIIFSLIFINIKYWFGAFFIKSWRAPFLLNFKLQSTRTKSQISYIKRILTDKKIQKMIVRKNWL
jgi:glucosyl-dolichyl phosphate glucuronosyltransferase